MSLLLGAHPVGVGVGEFPSLYAHERDPVQVCSCGSPLAECSFWGEVAARVEATTGWHPIRESMRRALAAHHLSMRRRLGLRVRERLGLGSRAYRQIARDTFEVFGATRHQASAEFLVDAAKSGYRALSLCRERPADSAVLHLIRDGRGVVRSKLKSNEGTLEEVIRSWRAEAERVARSVRRMPHGRVIHVHYERLCADPEAELARICDFIGVPYDPRMLDFRNPPQHVVAGNRMRLSSGADIRLDEAWRRDLTDPQLEVFERLAGELNRARGYWD